ncbi:HWE histidine kinase domain-containing protein [Pseudomonas caspiana]|uniref:HWE histidine kinase domain-containing protein n=1 Tax=Pseudomonas caspiana TaxID=1451454 RepID=UPI0032EEE012
MQELLGQLLNRAVDAMSSGAPAVPLLREFAALLQNEMPGCVVGINVLDKPGKTFRHAVFPSLPKEFASSLENNIITGNRGSCGLGVLTGRSVIVPDVANDERFSAEWKALFARHGLTSLISIPAQTSDGVVQGSLAIIHPAGSPLTDEQMIFAQQASALCAKVCAYSRTQETTQLLLGELEHRMRNLFSTMGGVASLTIKSYPNPSEFRQVFGERLVMMHRAHSLAFNASEISIKSLVEEMIAPYRKECDVVIGGPNIILTPEAASALALVLHELGTNASKYGSLSRSDGALSVKWLIVQADETGGHPRFELHWTESRGPEVQPPARKGYGSTMIIGNLRNALDGSALFFFDPLGFRCEIAAPFTRRLGVEVSPDAHTNT